MNEQEQIDAVKRNGYTIKFIESPSEAVQLAAANNNAIRFIESPTEAVQLVAVAKNADAIKAIKYPTNQVTDLHNMLWEL